MNFNRFENDIALERQIRLILNSIGNVNEGDGYFQFRCPVCGDSKTNNSKKRGYILKNKHPFIYFCHNCFYKKPAIMWMKEFYPNNYKDYFREILQENDKKQKPKLIVIKNPTIRKKNPEREQTKFFVPILKGETPIFEVAIKLCEDRNIPKDIWSKWFVAIDGMYKDRLIIPFFDDKNKIFYYQGRSLKGQMPKYLSRSGKHVNLYNYYTVDRNKPVIITEGPIDSIFLPNAIALTGVKIDDPLLKEFKHKRFLIDLDTKTYDTKKKTIELLTRGEYVFCWKKFMKAYKIPMRDKWDVNDILLYLKKDNFTYEELEPFFTNSIFDKVFFI